MYNNYQIGSYKPRYKTNNTPSWGYQNSGPQKKRSGCRQSQKDNRIVITGWNKRRNGFYSLVAIENKKSDTKSPRWFKMTCQITNKTTMESRTYSALWDKERNRMVINQIGMVANPGKNYFGKGGYKMQIRNK